MLYNWSPLSRYFVSKGPLVEDLPCISTWEFIFGNSSSVAPDKTVYVDEQSGVSLTWRDTRSLALRFANAFVFEFSLAKGDIVALVSSNSLYIPAFVLAAQAVGIICSPASALFNAAELEYQIADSCAKHVFCGEDQWSTAREVCERLGLPSPVILDKSDRLGKTTIWSSLKPETSCPTDFGTSYDPCNDIAVLSYSSGTSGKPKGVYTTHFNITSAYFQALQATASSFTRDEVWIAAMPMTHMYTLFFHIFVAMKIGATVVIMKKFSLDGYTHSIKRFGVTVSLHSYYKVLLTMMSPIKLGHIVPPIAVNLVQSANLPATDFSSLREWRSAAAPLGAELAQSLQDRTGVPVHCLYGMTEATAGVAYSDSSCPAKPGSVGLLSPNIQAKIVDGELRIKGPNMMIGYHNTSDSPFDEEGYFITGDRVHIDSDDFVFVVDRVKEVNCLLLVLTASS
jgi:4-coumarate--CoA ligase